MAILPIFLYERTFNRLKLNFFHVLLRQGDLPGYMRIAYEFTIQGSGNRALSQLHLFRHPWPE
jgi:hypothetical protein